jgi:sugar phosphate permease
MRERWLQLALSIWAGSLITVCAMVAPLMFQLLPDRHLAGTVAGFFFSIETAIGLVLGAIVLTLLLRSTQRSKTDMVLVLSAMIAPLLSEVLIRPIMRQARDVGDMARFGWLHGVSALLFLIACGCALMLVWRLARTTSAQN